MSFYRFIVGDRFYFYKNNTDSQTIKVGFKGVVDVVNRTFVEHEAYAFDYDEIKPIKTCYAVLGGVNLREEFEKTETFKLCNSWQIDFDDIANTYYSINPVFISDCIAINSAWMMFQELKK